MLAELLATLVARTRLAARGKQLAIGTLIKFTTLLSALRD